MNEIRLYGTCGGSFWDDEFFTSAQVIEQLSAMSGPVTVRINSGGGSATEGQAIYTALVDYPGTVAVVIDAVAMSSASLIAMAGDTITMRLGSVMLIHDPAMPYLDGRGTEADHSLAARQLQVVGNAYAAVYAKRAGITVDEARQIMRDETILDGPMALQLGFATAIDDTAAEPVLAAKFDYRIYAHAPQALREASETLGAMPERMAVLAMMSGRAPKQNLNQKEVAMTDKTKTAPADNAEVKPDVVPPAPADPVDDTTVAQITASAGDRQRINRIRGLVEMAGRGTDLALDMIGRGISPEAAVTELLELRVKEDKEMSGTLHHGYRPATITADGRDKFRKGAELSIMSKVGMKGGERNEFSSMSLSELARASIEMSGERRTFNSRMDMVGHAFTMAGAHGTSDFGSILANIQGKSALQGWDEADETYPTFTRAGTLSDFKATKRVGLGNFSSLVKVEEGADYSFGTVGDRGEPIVLATYGRMLRITRQAIINDDLSLLGSLPRKMGRAARRTIGDLVFAVITGNPAMSDGVTLFHANHKNLAATGALPSIQTLSDARTAMRTQREATGGPALNITPKYMIVPAAQETLSRQLLTSAVDPTANKGHAINPVAGMAELVVDGRLDAVSSTGWYLAADPNAFDVIEVAYLDGVQAPYLEQQQMWTADGVEMKVRIDAGVAPLDYRTLYKNAGA